MKIPSVLLLFLSLTCLASPMVTFYGTLIGYNARVAEVRLENGSVARVPRSSINSGHVGGLMVGRAIVVAQVTVEDLVKLNPKLAKVLELNKQ